ALQAEKVEKYPLYIADRPHGAEMKAIHYSPESRALYYVIAEISSFN
ncbi:2631_t:CDS:1, partial [Paraglomus brasilianum]